ncbi:MAG: hypothetical protein RBU37_09725 [Myxococcota bacterium]|nr:hypothetical protein [Myxococcota bacterium]
MLRCGVFCLALCLSSACEREQLPDPQEEARLAAAQNRCQHDEQCALTGCRNTVCRAEADPSFCEHRLVLAVERAEPSALLELARELIAASLTPQQLETLTISPQDGSILIAFHAPMSQRARVEAGLSELESGGIYAPHPNSEALARQALAAHPTLQLRRAEGGPLLLEAQIESGDILSFEDVRIARERLHAIMLPLLPQDALLATEALLEAQPPVLRAWVLDTESLVSFQELLSINLVEQSAKEQRFEGQFSLTAARALARLSQPAAQDDSAANKTLLFVIGEEVLVAAVRQAPITDGRFVLRLRGNQGDDRNMAERLRKLRNAPTMTRQLRFDRAATQDAERGFACVAAQANPCRCIDGFCQHQSSPEFEACIAGR